LKLFREFDTFIVIFNPFLFGAKVSYNDFGFFGVVPKIRSEGFFFLISYLNRFGINVKDTSLTHQGDQ
jgi:hypothetical protein